MELPRDKIGEGDALFLQKSFTDRAIGILEALLNLKCTGGKWVLTEKSATLTLGGDPLKDMIVVLNGAPYYVNLLTDGRLEEL